MLWQRCGAGCEAAGRVAECSAPCQQACTSHIQVRQQSYHDRWEQRRCRCGDGAGTAALEAGARPAAQLLPLMLPRKLPLAAVCSRLLLSLLCTLCAAGGAGRPVAWVVGFHWVGEGDDQPADAWVFGAVQDTVGAAGDRDGGARGASVMKGTRVGASTGLAPAVQAAASIFLPIHILISSSAAACPSTHASAANECLKCRNAKPRQRVGSMGLRGRWQDVTSPYSLKMRCSLAESVNACRGARQDGHT